MTLSNKQYNAIVFAVVVIAMTLITRMRYCGEISLPGKPARPVAEITNAQEVSKRISLSSEAFNGYLIKDAKAFGIPPASPRQMAAAFPYRADRERRVLAPGDTTEVLGMKLVLTVEKVKGSSRKHMILTIENQGHKALAYRIETKPSSGNGSCGRMRQLRHNALALAAGETLKRAECLYRKGRTLEISRVETIVLPELGYYYLSAMDAQNFALGERTSGLHSRPSKALVCRIHQASTLRNAILSGTLTWRNQAEFYARHRCNTYSFSGDFSAFEEDGEQSLPAIGGDL